MLNILACRRFSSYGLSRREGKDIAHSVRPCIIDLFEQHITLRFPLVRANEQSIDLMSAHQKPGPPPSSTVT